MRTTTLLVAVCVGLALAQGAAAVEPGWCDDFESYQAGTYPSPAWHRIYSGAGASVTTEAAYSGDQSFKLTSTSGWSRADGVDFVFPNEFCYSVAVMVEPNSPGGMAGLATSQHPSPLNGPVFDVTSGRIVWEGPDFPVLLEAWERGKWYHVTACIEGFHGSSPMADVTIAYDSTSVTHANLGAHSRSDADRDTFQLHTWSQASSTLFFDDVCLVPEPATLGLLVVGGLALIRRHRK